MYFINDVWRLILSFQIDYRKHHSIRFAKVLSFVSNYLERRVFYNYSNLGLSRIPRWPPVVDEAYGFILYSIQYHPHPFVANFRLNRWTYEYIKEGPVMEAFRVKWNLTARRFPDMLMELCAKWGRRKRKRAKYFV